MTTSIIQGSVCSFQDVINDQPINEIFKVPQGLQTPSAKVSENVNKTLFEIRKKLKFYENKKANELKSICKEMKLKCTGSKWDLIRRIQFSIIDFDQFGESCIRPFIKWANPYISFVSESSCSREPISFSKDSIGKSLVEFLTVKNKNMTFASEDEICDYLDIETLDEQSDFYRFIEEYISPQEAIFAWILLFDAEVVYSDLEAIIDRVDLDEDNFVEDDLDE
jgi:hypothetical protein